MVSRIQDRNTLHLNLSSADDDMVDSFFVIPSKAEPPISLLKHENTTLKAQLEKQRERLEIAERMLKQRQEQDHHLRESIILARKEVRSYSSPPSLSRVLMQYRHNALWSLPWLCGLRNRLRLWGS